MAQIVHDDDAEPPWDREDGQGPVSNWTDRVKEPGERTLCEDGGSRRYYDVQEATRIAKRDVFAPDAETLRVTMSGQPIELRVSYPLGVGK